MNLEDARAIAEEKLHGLGHARPLALFPDESVRDYGWCYVFPWNTARYLETRDRSDALGPGTGPIVVVKESRDAWFMGSALPHADQLDAYAAEHGIGRS
jgi:hypothetical protein